VISTVEKVLFLKSIDLFSQIPGEDLSQIAQITDEVQFDEGDEVFREGDPGDTLYFVIDGKVRIHTGGDEIAVIGERQVFGEMTLLDSEPRSASASAITDLTLLKIHRDDFNEILAEKSEIASGIIKVLTRRLRNTLDKRRSFSSAGQTDPGIQRPTTKA
jgi:CRP/FNR family transcriptional regulator, cyclic AMP receptor protein